MSTLAQFNREKLIDLLSERLAFERAGVRLYDTILGKVAAPADRTLDAFRGDLQRYRDEEKEHEEWLEAEIRALGGDAHEKTERVELVERATAGLEQVASTEPLMPHVIHALLTAELVDNAGWELLLELADDADDRAAREEFRRRLHDEEEHLAFARTAVLRFARKDVLGYERRIAAPS